MANPAPDLEALVQTIHEAVQHGDHDARLLDGRKYDADRWAKAYAALEDLLRILEERTQERDEALEDFRICRESADVVANDLLARVRKSEARVGELEGGDEST